jgi:hypothetical protein
MSGILLKLVRDKCEDSGLALAEHGTLTENGTHLMGDIEDSSWDVWDVDRLDQRSLVCLPVCVRHDPYNRREDDEGDGESYKASWERSLKTGIDDFQRQNKIFGLILRPVRKRRGVYVRVGLCSFATRKTIEISKMAFGERRFLTIV